MEWFSLAAGITIDKVASLDQETRNHIGKKLLELTLMELFVFRFMQACYFALCLYLCTSKILKAIVDIPTLATPIGEFRWKHMKFEVYLMNFGLVILFRCCLSQLNISYC